MAPPKKYLTEEEKKLAKSETCRKYRETHREHIHNHAKVYYESIKVERKEILLSRAREYKETHKELILNRAKHYYYSHSEEVKQISRERGRKRFGHSSYYEELTPETTIANITSESEYVLNTINQMEQSEGYAKFVELLKSKGITNEDDIQEIYNAAAKTKFVENSKRGYEFEKIIQTLLLNMLNETGIYLYRQVPYNNHKCRIDFVISEEKCKKDDLNVNNGIIISTKTRLGTSWREDQHLYDKCRAYFMITLDTRTPREEVPANVFFCSPNVKEESEHIINLDSLLDKIVEFL